METHFNRHRAGQGWRDRAAPGLLKKCLGKVLLFLSLGIGVVVSAQAASLEFNPAVVQLSPGESVMVEVIARDVPASGLAAFQFDLQFDSSIINIVDPNRAFGGAVPAYAPLGNNPFCGTVRGAACVDSDWMLITTGRIPLANISQASGKISVLYGTSGSTAAPSGTGVIALIEVVAVAGPTTTIDFSNAIIADNGNPPRSHPLTLSGLGVQVDPANQPPSLALVDNVSINEGGTTSVVLTGSDPDPGTTLVYTTTTLPAFMTLNGDTLDIAPGFDDAGSYPVTATVSDGNLTASRSFNIEVGNSNRAPTLNALDHVLVNIGDTTAITLVGSDPDTGTVLIFGATGLPDFATLSGDTISIAPGNDDTGNYPVSASVNDGLLSDNQNFNIIVLDNQTPTALLDLQDDQGQTVTDGRIPFAAGFILSGSGSVDIGGSIVKYIWTALDTSAGQLIFGTPIETSNDQLVINMPGTRLPVGQHRFQLQVEDDSGNLSAAAIVTVIVVDTQAPTAVLELRDIGGALNTDGRVGFGSDFILDGSRSVDIGGTIVLYRWSNASFPSGTLQTTSPTLDVNAALTGGSLAAGQHTFGLVVEDDSGNLSTLAQINVIVVQNQAPIADAGSAFNLLLGAIAMLNGSNSIDPDGSLITFAWEFFDTPAASALVNQDITASDIAMASFTPDVVGDYVLRLTVDDGDLSSSNLVTVSAFVLNIPPVADAGTNHESLLGETIVLDASGSTDADSSPAALGYLWALISKPVGSSVVDADIQNMNSETAQIVADVVGDYVFSVFVTDGEDFDEAQVTVTVAQANLPPVANAGDDQSVDLGDIAFLTGSGSDPDNGPDLLTGAWHFTSLPVASSLDDSNILGAVTENASFLADVVGEYILSYQVSDGDLTASDQVVITVTDQVIVVLPAPENVIARSKRGRVTMIWDPVDGAVFYRVYKRTNLDVDFAEFTVTEGTIIGDRFTTGVTTIEYYVVAENGFGSGDVSVTVTVTPGTR